MTTSDEGVHERAADAAGRVLVLAPDAEEGLATTELEGLLAAAADAAVDVEAVTWHGGPRLADLRRHTPVSVVTELAGRTPAAVAERALVKARRAGAGHAVRRRRLGIGPWGRRPPHAVLLGSPRAAPLLRYLPEPTGAPIVVLVPAGELTDANLAPLSDDDLGRLLARTDRFLVEGDASWEHLVATLGVDPSRLVPVGETLVATAPERPSAERMAGWRERLGIAPGTRVVVGSGPLVWDGGTDLFVRAGWMLRERLGQDVALVWVGRPGHDLELTQLRHDIGHMGLDGHVHLLLGPDDGEALWLGDVHLVTSRLPETPLLHVPGASRGQALVAWEAPLLRRFTGGDAARMIDFLDMAGLAQATADLLVDDDARAALGARALGRYRDWHVAEDRPPFLLRMLREAR